jgi:protein tyrosine phosphatase (PTP) superfamily phosphohydrolase (DUF442 family)
MPISTTQGPTSKRRPLRLAIGAALLLAACAIGNWYVSETYHLATVQDGVLYRVGNRGMREFSTAVRRVRPKTVVSLVDDKELNDPSKPQFAAEADFLSSHGIRQVRVPVALGGWPSSDDIQKFLAIVADPKNRPVLVHCAQGVRRTGMFVAAYQESAMKFSPADAKNDILSFGHSDHVVDDVKAFIDAYDPVTMSVATTMPAASSSE